ncbi:uncharacterized protein EKO05_0001477 [Ascochyta rabiei]|uniref:Uncharacterized protein n=1 Tax=Didymella rabiei TaxID=5454 RepID=A0A163CZS6_DIDRA|nr:uncharacterized protein EKO05_0001477 [Ascochyta rabiei]KZM22809.1 hypothetical protein ST47_g6076 [Ascochyta rabiei]UPX10839.1 hypothetical protein EKO05_0001477 [Ascochyta rabiei]
MLARGALCRLAAEVSKQATHDLPKLASLVQTTRHGSALAIRTLSRGSQLQTRSYATTKAATTPTETVKKAVKAKAAAGKSVKKTTTAKRTSTTKKAAANTKAAPKKAKKKAAPKKPATKRAPKKVLTPEEKEKLVIRKLRLLALKEPVSNYPVTAFNIYISEALKGTGTGATAALSSKAATWKNVTPAEHERYNHLAAERNESNAAAYKAWIETHTPDQIRIANNARAQLRKKLAGTLKSNAKPSHTRPLMDERRVLRPRSSWTFFFAERSQSSDFTGIRITDRTNLLAAEWKALDANERKKYEDKAAADKQRWTRETSALASSST